MFTDQQKADLAAKLHADHVKTRKQGGRGVSYIEGWHAIAEANRIFGFDGWFRETVDIRCVWEGARQIGQPPNQREGWGVTYTAKVRVTVGNVVREGCGSGHGIDVDCGQAHESALKEAETDAMKRALMTFGNPFGLALYDKDQENVERGQPANQQRTPAAPSDTMEQDAKAFMERAIREIGECQTEVAINKWWSANGTHLSMLHDNFPMLFKRVDAAATKRSGEVPQLRQAG